MLQFTTPGIIDLDALLTFGVSAKTNESSIGFFGTGFKYAVATLLRTGHTVVLSTGGNLYSFTSEAKLYRDKNFSVVLLNGTPLNFTTDLGKKWEVWMALRELHSNTLDEGGSTTRVPTGEVVELKQDESNLLVEGPEIEKAYSQMSTIFCDSAVVASTPVLELRSGPSKHLFFRGVRVRSMHKEPQFTYNLLSLVDLTEDRTDKFPYYTDGIIRDQIAFLKNKDALSRILTSPKGTFEGDLDFSSIGNFSDEFREVCLELKDVQSMNITARRKMKEMGYISEIDVPLSNVEKQQFQKAMKFLRKLGFNVDEYKIRFVDLQGMLGRAKGGTIFVAPQAFRMGTKYVAGTLLEEYIHLKEGVGDETRAMQNVLIDTIMSLGERVVKKPL